MDLDKILRISLHCANTAMIKFWVPNHITETVMEST